MKSSCTNCGQPKPMSEWVQENCGRCTTANHEGQQHFAAEHEKEIAEGKISHSDILYAGRMAMGQYTIRPGSNYVDPRTFSGSRRELPTPNRGNTSGS